MDVFKPRYGQFARLTRSNLCATVQSSQYFKIRHERATRSRL